MQKEVTHYAFFWNVQANEGHILLQFADGSTAQTLLDSPSEGSLLVDILRNEKPVYYDQEHDILLTGLEMVGEGEQS